MLIYIYAFLRWEKNRNEFDIQQMSLIVWSHTESNTV